MPQYGIHGKFNIIILTWLLTTSISNILIIATENVESSRYNLGDVENQHAAANFQTVGMSKGHTTRILTTAEVDDNFWLKYLGEEFRHAVHLQVDHDNNVSPAQINTKHHSNPGETIFNTNNIEQQQEKRTRFVRQPSDDKDTKHIPVESSRNEQDDDNNNENSHEESQNTDDKSSTPKHNLHKNTNNDNNLKHKKILIQNKYKKIKLTNPNPLKAIHTPIVVNLPETQKTAYQINDQEVPVVVQMPPVIYHQKADSYPEIYHGHVNLPVHQHHQHTKLYQTQQHYHNTLQHKDQQHFQQQQHSQQHPHHGQIYTTHPYQTLPLPAVPLSQITHPSFVIPQSNDARVQSQLLK